MKKLLFLFVFVGSMTAHASTSFFRFITIETSCGTIVNYDTHPDDTAQDIIEAAKAIDEMECGQEQ